METPMMKCGHAANATRGGEPVCVICVGIRPGAIEIDPSPPDMSGRQATCTTCRRAPVPSSASLAFFSYLPDWEFDSYYCGCRGWD